MRKSRIFISLCALALITAMLFTGCGREDRRDNKKPDEKSETSSETVQNSEEVTADDPAGKETDGEKTDEGKTDIKSIINFVENTAALTYAGKLLDFSFLDLADLSKLGVDIKTNLDKDLASGEVSDGITAVYGDLEFTVKLANLTDDIASLKDCVVVACDFVNNGLSFAGIKLSNVKKEYLKLILGVPYKETDTKYYYMIPAFDGMNTFHEDYSKYIVFEFTDGKVSGVSFVIPEAAYHNLNDNIEDKDIENVENMTATEILTAEEKRDMIAEKLAGELDARGVGNHSDSVSGAIVVDSETLFAHDAFELSEEGKELIKKVSEAYSVVFSDKELMDSIASISFEGHASPHGDYDYNLELSNKRAIEVRNCFISALSAEDAAVISEKSVAKGFSFNCPKYDADGNIDDNASRRVEIHFNIAID